MTKTKPTNLLILMSDQHSRSKLGCYGNPAVKTPNLDALAASGTRFTNAYCNSPLCVPSRAAMATGQYASVNGYWDNAHAFEGKADSWAKRLHEQGYHVATVGKLHFQDERPETGFVDQRIPLHIKGGVGDIYGAIRDDKITRYQFRDALLQAKAGESDYTRYDRAIAAEASRFLTEEAPAQEKPFVLFASFATPHFPLIAPQEFVDLYPDPEALPLPIEFEPEEWPHHPLIEDYRRYCGTAQVSREQARHAIRIYYALCSFMDAQVGTVLRALKASGLSENTRVLYCADHGDTMGDHGVYFKSTMYEGSAGIPMLLAGPGVPAGTAASVNVSLLDVYPTVLDAVGATPSAADAALPGASLIRLAAETPDAERSVCGEYYSQGIYTAMFFLRRGRYKYVHYVGKQPQLFDLTADPEERHDLAQDPAYASLCADLLRELNATLDTEKLERDSKAAQKRLLDAQGGVEAFLKTFQPVLFSPIPKL